MWSSNEELNDTFHTVTELRFDPTEGFHTYELTVNENDEHALPMDWTLLLYIDGEVRALLSGVSAVGPSGLVMISVYNREGEVAELTDMLNPPRATATFRNLR